MASAKRFEDLIVWQLATRFETWALEMSDQGKMLKDSDFRDQWRDAACSPARNIAEGFAKYQPPEFARFVNIARGSLGELQNQMIRGRARGLFREDQFLTGWRLLCRTIRATNRFHAYLRSCGRQGPVPRHPSGNDDNSQDDANSRNFRNPDNPDNLGNPDNPENPENPESPENPGNPENPENPDPDIS